MVRKFLMEAHSLFWVWMRESYYERRYWRLCFDGLRISQIPLNCHKLGNGNAPEVYIICVCKFFTQACSSCLCFDACIVYIRLRGAFRVARFDNSGMREPLSRGTSDSEASRFLSYA